jgi:gluconokinase
MPAKKTTEGVLALDLGTSSVRAVVYDTAGAMIGSSLCDLPYKVRTREAGEVSSDAQALVRLIGKAIDGALLASRKHQVSLLAVATSCYWHSLLGIDAHGRPSTELLTWADTRSAAQTRQFRDKENEHAYHARTGCFFHASYWPAKLRWLHTTRPAVFDRTARWISLGEFLYRELFGEAAVSLSIASGTGLLAVNEQAWDQEALALAGITDAQLSRLADWDQPCHGLRGRYESRWPELKSLPWYLPLGDGALANVGADAVTPTWACATIGTSSALRVINAADHMEIPWGVFVYRLDRRRFVIGGALSEGGNVVRWFSDGLGLKDGKRLAQAAGAIAPDSHGLTILPFWAGERSPNWRGDARAAIVGLSLATQSTDLMRASMEAITYQMSAVADSIEGVSGRPRAIIATGGQLLHSPAWCQMLADALDLPVVTSPEPEASSRGAALLTLGVEGRMAGLWSIKPKAGRRFRPRRRVHEIYQRARERQQHLYELLFPAPGKPEHATPTVAAESGSKTKHLRTPAAKH